MKIRTVRILLSRGWTNVMYIVSLFVFSMLSVNSSAQTVSDNAIKYTSLSKVTVSGSKPAAGDMITGRVSNSEGPMMMVRVEEKDSKDRLVARAVTDIDGNFSFKLVDPADRLEIIYIGYHTAISGFSGNSMDVKLVLDSLLINNEIDSILINAVPLIIREDRYQGMHARAYGPQYPLNHYPLLLLDGNIKDPFSVDMQCLDSIVSRKFDFDGACVAKLFRVRKRQIKSYTVLKDAAAIAVWGQRGANGVIEVTTKDWYRKQKKARKLNRL